jgi:hypothetical protein
MRDHRITTRDEVAAIELLIWILQDRRMRPIILGELDDTDEKASDEANEQFGTQ